MQIHLHRIQIKKLECKVYLAESKYNQSVCYLKVADWLHDFDYCKMEKYFACIQTRQVTWGYKIEYGEVQNPTGIWSPLVHMYQNIIHLTSHQKSA